MVRLLVRLQFEEDVAQPLGVTGASGHTCVLKNKLGVLLKTHTRVSGTLFKAAINSLVSGVFLWTTF